MKEHTMHMKRKTVNNILLYFYSLVFILAICSCGGSGKDDGNPTSGYQAPSSQTPSSGSGYPAEFQTLLSKAADDAERDKLKDLFNTDALRQCIADLINSDNHLKAVIDNATPAFPMSRPRRDDSVWGTPHNLLFSLCDHGENLIFVKHTKGIYITAFQNNKQYTDEGAFYCIYDDGGTIKHATTGVKTLQEFQALHEVFGGIPAIKLTKR